MFESALASLRTLASLRNDCAHDNVAHCYLVVGADKLLLDAFCEEAVYCVLGGATHADVLYRKVKDRTHADVLYFPQEAKYLNKEEYDRLTAELGFAPIDGERRVFVIDAAEAMKPNIQNRLLKTLEEPHAGYVFLLKAATAAPLLQTVISRSRVLELGGLSTELVRDSLSEVVKAEPNGLCVGCAVRGGQYHAGEIAPVSTRISRYVRVGVDVPCAVRDFSRSAAVV